MRVCWRIRKSTKQFHFGSENCDLRATTLNKPYIQPALQGQMQVDTENRKYGEPDHPEIGKSEINQKPIFQKLETAAFV